MNIFDKLRLVYILLILPSHYTLRIGKKLRPAFELVNRALCVGLKVAEISVSLLFCHATEFQTEIVPSKCSSSVKMKNFYAHLQYSTDHAKLIRAPTFLPFIY